jgi:hypothetical protein
LVEDAHNIKGVLWPWNQLLYELLLF